MIYIVALLGIAVVFLSLRVYLLKQEIKRAASQLEEASLKKINVRFQDSDMEHLAEKINEQIDAALQAKSKKQRTENEWKQAIADMSHDIRTPLTSISGFIQFLDDEGLPASKRREYTATIKKSAARLKNLLDEFFELSLAESPDYPLQVEPVRLNQAVLEVLVSSYEEFKQRGIEPRVALPDEEIVISADLSAVKRVTENLLANAVKHAKGEVAIQLIEREETVRLIIRNEAGQLADSEIPLLFNRFYKLDKTRMDKGAGLGLSIAKSHMERMGGSLKAELRNGELWMVCEWKTKQSLGQ